MWRCATGHAEATGAGLQGCRGVALVAALIVLLVLSAMGLGLVLTTSLEPAAAANYECALRARYGAEAGAAVAVHDLAAAQDWTAALAGGWQPAHLQAPPAELPAPDGTRLRVAALTNVANCGHEAACGDAEMDAFTPDRPWGPNNPRWHPVGVLKLETLEEGPPGLPGVVVVVWVGDDPADLDGDPLRDSPVGADGTRAPGACVVAVRAEAFSARAAHRMVTATVSRVSPACGAGGRVVAWREYP
jgi:hypothetical protein